jgi:hypothetical protein
MKYFESRFKKVVAAKKEIAGLITPKTVKNGIVLKGPRGSPKSGHVGSLQNRPC